MAKTIVFDMDGTVYDLYNVDNWLEKLNNSDVSVYADGAPMVDLTELETVCLALIAKGWEISVITWLAKDSDTIFDYYTTETKRAWVKINMPYVKNFTAQKYGTPKQKALSRSIKKAILVDDNADVCAKWDTPIQRKSINAGKVDIIAKLWELV